MGVFFPQTVPADTGKAETAAFHLAACDGFGLRKQLGGNLHLMQVNDRIAVPTDEMHMGVGISVVAFHTLDGGHTLYHPLLSELCQIPIHRCHAQIGDLSFQVGVNGLGGRMSVGCLQVGENGVTLAEIL